MASSNTGTNRSEQEAAQASLELAAQVDMHLKIASEYAARARHHDIVRATIDVGLVTFTSLSFVLYAAIYSRPDPNIYVLFAIAFLVITLGLFGIVFSAGREISIRRWLAASDSRFEAASERAGIRPGSVAGPPPRQTFLTNVIYALMAAAMVGPGLILIYATWHLMAQQA